MKGTCFITCNSCVSLFLSNGMKTLFWLQVPTGRCSSLWRIFDCSGSSQTGRCSPLLAQVTATFSSLVASQTGRCSPLLEVFSGVCGHGVIRRVSISPTDTEPEPDDMEPSAAPLPMEIDERPGVRGAYEVRFPAVTPVTPPAIGLSHAQWCDKVMNE